MEANLGIRRELKRINQLEMTVAYPFLLGLFETYSAGNIDNEELLSTLRLLQSFVFRRFICNLPTNSLNKIFATLYDNVEKVRSVYPKLSFYDGVATVLVRYSSYQKFPTDDEVIENLKIKNIYKSQSKNKNYLLEMLENNYSHFNENEIDLEANVDITIEHIFPQTPNQDWKKSLIQEEYEEMRTLVDTLGNLTIVINNASLGNKPFIYKRDLDNDTSKGFRHSKFNLNDYLINLDKWGVNELNTRAKLLSSKFLEIWKYPNIKDELISSEKNQAVEVDIYDIEDATNKKPEYIELKGDVIKVNSFATLLQIVADEILKTEPEVFYIPEVQQKLKFTKDKNTLRTPLTLIQGNFIECNYSANYIVSCVKTLLENSTDMKELVIKFKE